MGAKSSSGFKGEAEELVMAAIKAPEVVNIEEILTLDAVKELKNSSKEVFSLVDLIVKSDIANFQKQLAQYKSLMEKNKMTADMLVEKKRFIEICSQDIEVLSFADLAKMLNLKEDEVEEWAIMAINHDILDGRIDQINEKLIIKTHRYLYFFCFS